MLCCTLFSLSAPLQLLSQTYWSQNYIYNGGFEIEYEYLTENPISGFNFPNCLTGYDDSRPTDEITWCVGDYITDSGTLEVIDYLGWTRTVEFDSIFFPAIDQSYCGGTPDYFHKYGTDGDNKCNTDWDNYYDYRKPYGQGQGYVGLHVIQHYVDGNRRIFKEYITTKLKETLSPGTYRISFRISRAGNARNSSTKNTNHSLKGIGVYLSTEQLVQDFDYSVLPVRAFSTFEGNILSPLPNNGIENNDYIVDTADVDGEGGWTLIEDVVNITSSNLQYLTIGHFGDSLYQDVTPTAGPFDDIQMYYFIDSVIIQKQLTCDMSIPYTEYCDKIDGRMKKILTIGPFNDPTCYSSYSSFKIFIKKNNPSGSQRYVQVGNAIQRTSVDLTTESYDFIYDWDAEAYGQPQQIKIVPEGTGLFGYEEIINIASLEPCCDCEDFQFTLDVSNRGRNTDTSQCCLYFDVDYTIPFESQCRVDSILLVKNFGQTPEYITTFIADTSKTDGKFVVQDYCIPEESDGYQFSFSAIYYMNDGRTCIAFDTLRLECQCNCSTKPKLEIIPHPDNDVNEDCCYDLIISNPTDCYYRYEGFKLTFEEEGLLSELVNLDKINPIIDGEITEDGWYGVNDTTEDGITFKYYDVIDSTTFNVVDSIPPQMPRDTMMSLCIPKTGQPVKMSLVMTQIGHLNKDECDLANNYDLQCDPDCCYYLQIELEEKPGSTPPNCEFQVKNVGSILNKDCIFGYKVTGESFQNGMSLGTVPYVEIETGQNPVNFSSLVGLTFVHNENVADFTIVTFEFFGIYGEVKCLKQFTLTCDTIIDEVDCCDPEVNQSWVEYTTSSGGGNCDEDECSVLAMLKLPPQVNCFTQYRVNSTPPYMNIPAGGYGPLYLNLGCLDKGEFRQDTIYLFGPADTCVIIKNVVCSVNEFPEPCTPDCDTVAWDGPETVTVDLCDGCIAEGTFRHRKNTCTGTQDIQIMSFYTRSSDPADTTACLSCPLTVDEIHAKVLLKAIHDNKMGFDPIQGDSICYSTWRVIQASCWASYETATIPLFGGPVRIVTVNTPCDSTECCSIGLEVCRHGLPPNESITVQTLTSNTPPDTCGFETVRVPSTNPGPPQTAEVACENKCNWLYGLVDSVGFYGKENIEYDIETEEYIGSEEFSVKMKFGMEYIDLLVETKTETSNLEVSIHALEGYNLISEHYNLKKGINFYQIITSKLITGMYVITLEVNGLQIKSEKFIIVR